MRKNNHMNNTLLSSRAVKLMASISGHLVTATVLLSINTTQAREAAYAYPGSDGKLVYVPHANIGQTNNDNIIPDFSRVGYKAGGVTIPVADNIAVPVKYTLNPGSGDRLADIKTAIAAVAAEPLVNGFRGAVLLKAGTYEISNGFEINTSGVVLRGEGQGEDGTLLKLTGGLYSTAINFSPLVPISVEETDSTRITTAYVGTGATSFAVDDASSYGIGDDIFVTYTPNQTWLDDIHANDYMNSDDTLWATDDYNIQYDRKITALSGNTITIDSPIVSPIQNLHGGAVVTRWVYADATSHLENVGVENLRIDGAVVDYMHTGVLLNSVKDGWVSGVTVLGAAKSTVKVEDSKFVTVQDSAYLKPLGPYDGSYRYSFYMKGKSNHVLMQRNFSELARHDFVLGSRVPGPNVFLDSMLVYGGERRTATGPHHRWSTGVLFDNLKVHESRVIAAEHRGNAGTGHGWVAAQMVTWNINGHFVNDAPKGYMNYAIGSTGKHKKSQFVNNSNPGVYSAYTDSRKKNVDTRSLYLQQLEDRLGATAVANITTAAQREGDIYAILDAWRGEGDITGNEGDYDGNEAACAAAGYFYGWDDLCYASSSVVPNYTANVTADAYVKRGDGSAITDYGTREIIKNKNTIGSKAVDRIIIMKFDVSAANSATITSATLNVYGYTKNGDSATQSIKGIDDDSWTETGVTWNNLPTLGSTANTVNVADAAYGWRTIDITALVQGEIIGDGTLSLAIDESNEANVFFYMRSKEYNAGSNKAFIEIDF